MITWELISVVPNLSDTQCRVLDNNFELAKRLTIGPIPSWVKEDRILDNLSWPDRSMIEKSNYYLRFLYESKGIRSKQREAEELLKYASLALWLAKPVPCGINAHLHFDRPDGQRIQRSATWGDQLLSHKRDNQNILTRDDLLSAKNLLEQLILIPKKQCTMRTSINLLWRALIDPWWQSRYLCMWIALEAMYGPD